MAKCIFSCGIPYVRSKAMTKLRKELEYRNLKIHMANEKITKQEKKKVEIKKIKN